MNLNSLPSIKSKSYRRIGRGHGSGRVKTSGRGTKGQKARENVSLKFAGSSLQASWLKRLPLLRGKGKNKVKQVKVAAVNVSALNHFKANSEVTLKKLHEIGLIGATTQKVKILGDGEITVPVIVKLPCSASAKAKIEKVGGKVE